MSKKIQHSARIPDDYVGLRLDQALAKLFPNYSRTQIQDWIKEGNILLNGEIPKARIQVFGGEDVRIEGNIKPQPTWSAEAIKLNIIYEDDEVLVINKPPGMVVHPAAGNMSSTLLNALLHHAKELKDLPRAGIVHRLDKDTSGLLVVAKTDIALQDLTRQLKNKSVTRIYQAIVCGLMTSGGRIDEPIGRHPIQRKKMCVNESGKPAVTHFRLVERYRAHTRLKVQLETGRTHQIRVHLAHLHFPILGDQTYGGRLQLPKGATPPLINILRSFKRQALHAAQLGFVHPSTGKELIFEAPLPQDMQDLISILKEDSKFT